MPTTHALLNPSAAHRWLICTPSARLHAKLNARLGDQGSAYAAEGTLAHSLAELKLRLANAEINQFRFDAERKLLGDIPSEMDRATDYYVDVVLERLYAARKVCEDARLFVEQRLDMSRWVPQCFGTSDAVIVSDQTLEVLDLKYGKGVPVDAVDNPICPAVCVLSKDASAYISLSICLLYEGAPQDAEVLLRHDNKIVQNGRLPYH